MSNYPPPPPPPPPDGPPGWGQPGPQQWTPPGQPQWAPGQQQWAPPGQQQWAGQQQWQAAQPTYGGGRRFAGFWSRFAAAFIDGLILSPFGILARIVLASGKKEIRVCSFNADLYCKVPTSGTRSLYYLIVLIGFVVGLIYVGLLEGRTGQTLGKRALGISVLDTRTAQPIGVGRAIGRHFAKFLSAIPCFLGYLWMLWDPNKQTWHDKIVSSYVVTA